MGYGHFSTRNGLKLRKLSSWHKSENKNFTYLGFFLQLDTMHVQCWPQIFSRQMPVLHLHLFHKPFNLIQITASKQAIDTLYQFTIGKYQIHWYYITRTTRQHGRAVLASKFFSADPSAPFAFVPHRSVVYSIRIWQHVHTISKRLTCYWQGHMMCGAA